MKQIGLFFDEPEPEPPKPMLPLNTGQQKAPNAYTEVILTPAQILKSDIFSDKVEARKGGVNVFEAGNRKLGRRQSTRAELALAIHTGLPWTGGSVQYTVAGQHLPDVGEDIEVRWTEHQFRSTWWLYLQRRDLDMGRSDSRFVLATGLNEVIRFHGWAYGDEVMQDRWWNANMPYPCWNYPEHRLYPMEELL